MNAYKISDVKDWWKEKPDGKFLSVLISPHNSSSKNVSIGVVVLEPGVESDEHSHKDGVEEIFFVISGNGEIQVGEDIKQIEPEMVIFGDAGKPHRLHNSGEEVLKVLWILSPPGEESRIIRQAAKTDEVSRL